MVWAAGSRTMPTCPGAAGVPSAPAKKTRSPGWTWLAGICRAVGPLGLAGARDGDPGGAVGHHGQARAVEGVRAGRPVLVALPELGFGVGEDLPGGAGGQRAEGGLLAYGAAGGGDRLGAPGGVAGGLVQDVGDVGRGVVVGEDRLLEVAGRAVRDEEAGGGGDGVGRVHDVRRRLRTAPRSTARTAWGRGRRRWTARRSGRSRFRLRRWRPGRSTGCRTRRRLS